VHAEDRERAFVHYMSSFNRREPFEMEYRLRRHDGVYRWIFDRGVPFFDPEGRFAGYIGSCVDVHERHEADRAKSDFLSLMAHELRTPLTSLTAYAGLVERAVSRGEPVAPHLVERVRRQIARMASLVSELADAAFTARGGELPIVPQRTDLVALVNAVVEGVLDARVVVERPPAPMWADCDPHLIEQVVHNLVDNALKYSPDGGPVRVTLRPGDGTRPHELVVRDEGIGIPPAELPLITRRYYRASNVSSRHYPGLGIGLAASRGLVERHEGRMEIESALGRGTTVTVTLPVAPP